MQSIRRAVSTFIFVSFAVCWLQACSVFQPENYVPKRGQVGKDVMWLPTSDDLVLKMLDAAKVGPNDDLVDFFNGKGTVYNEETILKNGYKNLKPDRVVVYDNDVYLLDYKTGEKNQKHQNQINEYAFVLQEMEYKVVKKALVYIGEKIEVVLL